MMILIPFLLIYLHTVEAFSFAKTPTYYTKGEKVELLVNKVESDNTQLPFGYYDLSFVCPPGDAKPLALSLGQIMRGDRFWQSNFNLAFGVDVKCSPLCVMISRDFGLAEADELIRKGYVVHWVADGLPGATTFISENNSNKYYAAGFPLGFVENDTSYLYNHVMMVFRYHKEKNGKYTIVGFEVYPKSVSDATCPGAKKDYKNFPLTFEKNPNKRTTERKTQIPYTYSVYWREDRSVNWKSRWLLYYKNESGSHQIRWISAFNSLLLMTLLSFGVAVIILKIFKPNLIKNTDFLKKTSTSQNTLPLSSIDNDWKSIIGDYNVKPIYSNFLAICISSGIQILIIVCGVITIFTINNCSGIFFDQHHGTLYSLSISFFVCSGIVPSYVGIIVYKLFNDVSLNYSYDTSKVIRLSVFFSGFLPTLVLSVVMFINLFVKAKASSFALPIGTVLVLLLFFFFFQLPLGIIGGYYGNKARFQNFNTNINHGNIDSFKKTKVLNSINKTPILLKPIPSTILFGLIPFGIVYVELLYIFNSVWLEKTTFYFMHGFLFMTILSLVVVIAETTIVALYVSFTIYHNPQWQWLCFRVGSSIGWYIFGYSTYYFWRVLYVRDFVSMLLYFTYMSLASILIGFACGSIGVITGWIFVGKIFGNSKRD